MLIQFRGIIAERTEDVPHGEYGALVIAKDCSKNCPGCFNQHLKNTRTVTSTPENIVEEIYNNPLHTWCVLGGLEWSEDPAGLEAIATEARLRGLNVIIYTGCDPTEFVQRLGKDAISRLQGCYVKFGSYDETLKCSNSSFGIKLASSNQFISIL